MKKANKVTYRPATKEDFKSGATLVNSCGNEVIIQSKYDNGIWVAKVWSGSRHVGDVSVFESSANNFNVRVC